MGNGITGNWSTVSTVSAPGDYQISALLSGYKWSTGGGTKTIYYSFPGKTAYHDSNYSTTMEFKSYTALNATQQAQIIAALQTWENVANIKFTLIYDNESQAGDIRFAIYNKMDAASAAYAYYPHNSAVGGDVWFNSKYFNGSGIATGSYNYMAAIHEIGHALGLKHPGNYNAGGGSPAGPFLPTGEDKYLYSIMSYNHGSDFSSSINLTGPSIYDIKAIQYLYGVNTSAGVGNNTYKLDAASFSTLWDPNGQNTIDGSGVGKAQVIDLREGKFSYIESNACLGVAYGTRITDARTGTGVATVYCNDLGNTVTLGGSINTVYGGAGTDTVILSGKSTDYTKSVSGGTTVLSSVKGRTTLTGVETILYQGGSETDSGGTGGVKLAPTYVGSYGDTGIYRIALSSLGAKTISSITIHDDNFISGGSAGASGLDLDFLKISSADTTSGAAIRTMADEGGLAFSPATILFSKGYMSPWKSGDSLDWKTSHLLGSNADGSVNLGYATFNLLDGTNGSGSGSLSVGEGGRITFTFSTPIDPTGKYLYFGDVGGSNDGCYVSASSDGSSGTTSGISLNGTDGSDDLRLGFGLNAGLGAGNDTITGGAGDDVIDGGAGFNTAVFTGARAAYAITRSGNTLTVSGLDGTDTLTNIQRLQFEDRQVVGVLPSFQATTGRLTATAGGTALSIEQVAIDDVQDDARGTLSSKVQVNGRDITGVPSTLKKGWKVATTLDVAGSGATQLFFFGVDQVAGVGSGYGATWSLDAAGAVTATKIQIQMKRQGWEVAGAAEVNGIAGDEVVWQNTLTGDKAIWTDWNRDGAMDSGFYLSGLGQDQQTRIVGLCDLDKDGLKEFMLFNDATAAVGLYEATPSTATPGSVDVALSRQFGSHGEFLSAATAAGASYRVFDLVG